MVSKILPWLLALGLIVGLGLYKTKVLDKKAETAVAPASAGAGKAMPSQVKTYIVSARDISNPLFSNGTLLPNETAELRTEATGRISEIYFSEGQYVKKGALLLKINDADLQAQLHKNQYDLQFATDTEKRVKKLLDAQAIGAEEYEQAVNRINVLRADAEYLQAQIAKTQLYAPFDGVIGIRTVAPGSYVQAGTSVAPLRQVNPMKLEFTLPERYSGKVKPGTSVKFSLENSPASYSAKITLIDPQIDPDSRSLRVRAVCANPGNAFLSGAFARVEFPINEARQLMVPSQAVVPSAKGKQVFLVKNGKATPTPVTAGLRTADEVQILDGLQVGDTVITTGLLAIRPGSAVVEMKN